MLRIAVLSMRKFIILFAIIVLSSSTYGQISFDKTEKDEIKIGQVGTINAYIREIGQDSLWISWKISDLEATGSDNIFMAYDSETHNIEFTTNYDELEALNVWVEERQKTKTGGTVTLGEWKMSYVQSALGIPIFMWTGPTGNFESGINSEMRQRFMTRRYIEHAIEKHNIQKMKDEKRRAKRKSKG